jgi:predicted nucleic acid-binding protein
MNSGTRYVFDTNVIISALLFNTSIPGQAFTRALGAGTILISQSLVEELNNVLSRDKFNRYVLVRGLLFQKSGQRNGH